VFSPSPAISLFLPCPLTAFRSQRALRLQERGFFCVRSVLFLGIAEPYLSFSPDMDVAETPARSVLRSPRAVFSLPLPSSKDPSFLFSRNQTVLPRAVPFFGPPLFPSPGRPLFHGKDLPHISEPLCGAGSSFPPLSLPKARGIVPPNYVPEFLGRVRLFLLPNFTLFFFSYGAEGGCTWCLSFLLFLRYWLCVGSCLFC